MFRFWRKIRMIEFNSSIWFTWAMMERKKGVRMFSTQAHLSYGLFGWRGELRRGSGGE